MDINERVAKLETQTENQDKEINEIKQKLANQDKLVESVAEMASSMKYIQRDMTQVKEDVEATKNKVQDLENKPGKLGLGLWKWVLGIIGAGILGYLLNMFLS